MVTGGASGIGRATAIRVASEGAKVATFDVDEEGGQTAVKSISEAGGESRFWKVDVSKETDVRSAVASAIEWLGGEIDVLINVAGVLQGANVEIDEFPEETWDFVLDINLKGMFLVTKHVAGTMKRQHAGVIINTSSGAGVFGGSSSFAYGSSKGGTHGFTMVLESRLAPHGIRVNDVLPGSLDTPLKRAQVEETYRRTGDKATYERTMSGLLSPDGVASVMAFLASDDAKYVRGGIRTL